jgi:hypothetical protein
MTSTNSSLVIELAYGSDSTPNSKFASRFKPYDRLAERKSRRNPNSKFNIDDYLARDISIPLAENKNLIVMRPHIPDGELMEYDDLASQLSEVLGKDVSVSMLSQFETNTLSDRIVSEFTGVSDSSDGVYSVAFYMEVDGEKYLSIRRKEPTSNGELKYNNALVRGALGGLLKLHDDDANGVRDPRYPDRPYANAMEGPNYHVSANSFPSDIHMADRIS